MWDVSPTVHSTKLQLVGHFHHSNILLVHVLHIWMVATLRGGGRVPHPPKCTAFKCKAGNPYKQLMEGNHYTQNVHAPVLTKEKCFPQE